MTEGVVVALEAVQVIQDQLPRLARPTRVAGELEVFHQMPAIAQAGQRIGQREPARADEHREVLAHGEHQPRADREHGGRGEDQRSKRELLVEVAVDEHSQRGEQRDARAPTPAASPPPAAAWTRPRRPGGDRQQDRGGRPQAFDPGAGSIGVGGGLVEVGRVGDRVQEHARRDQQPHAPRTPTGDAERADREDQQQQVADRIGERDRDRGERRHGPVR